MAALVIVKQNFNEHDLIHFINYVASKLNWYQKVALKKREGSGPSGMNADSWMGILLSNIFLEFTNGFVQSDSKGDQKILH